VKFTALDAVALGFKTRVIAAGCRGVELSPGDCGRAKEEMRANGILVIEGDW
jgi:nicotinamidase/pyrazinamidase